jgi:hypothetical protein
MQFEALVIAGKEVRRVTAEVNAEQLLDRALEIAATTDTPWDVVIVGDLLDPLGAEARKSLNGRTSLLQAGLAIIGGVRGTGIPALVRELGLAANRAAGFRTDAYTAFVFNDQALVDALANKVGGGPRLSDRRESEGLIAVLAKPGYDIPWRRRS